MVYGDRGYGDDELPNPREIWEKSKPWIKRGLITIATIGTLVSVPYTVDTDSKGVVKRLGAYSATTDPGLNFKLPWGIDSVEKVPVKKIQKAEFGFRTIKGGIKTEYVDVEKLDLAREKDEKRRVPIDPEILESILTEASSYTDVPQEGDLLERTDKLFQSEYQMLTGDFNVVDVEFIVQYRIKDPVAYLFNVREKERTIRDISAAMMRLLVGDYSVDEVLTIGREEIQDKAKIRIQDTLDSYDLGLDVTNVKLQSLNPPKRVKPAFNDVNDAKQERETKINQAWQDYNEIIPKARGDAERMIKEAEGYTVERINNATGDAARFTQVLGEYQKAPDVTRKRLFIEAQSDVLRRVGKTWVIEQGGIEGGLGFLLNLGMGGESGTSK